MSFPGECFCSYQYFRSSQHFKEGSLVPFSPTQNRGCSSSPTACGLRLESSPAWQPAAQGSWEAGSGWARHSRPQQKPKGPLGQTVLGSGTRCQQWLSLKDICSCLPSRVWLGRVQLRSWPESSLKGKISPREHIPLSAG